MSAKRMRTIVVVALAPLGSVWSMQWSAAAPAAGSMPAAAPAAQTAARQPLSRDDVELILRQARSAIQQGNLDQAEALVTRAENARVHYSLFHLGVTPSSVRRELDRARRSQPPVNSRSAQGEPAGRSGPAPAPSSGNAQAGANVDPFAARNRALGTNPALPPALGSQPVPPSMPTGEYDDAAFMAAEQPRNLPSLGQAVVNPFAPAPGTAPAPARYEAGPPTGYAVAQAAWDQSTAKATGAFAGAGDAGGDDAPWALPNAPLPAGVTEQQAAIGSSFGLLPPQRSVPSRNPATRGALPPAPQSKDQALAHLTAGRQALDAGDVDLAEELARAASAVGVPESQFLPNEDRPSLLAWDIVRARQDQGGAQPAAARLPSTGPRYATQLGQPSGVPAAPAARPAQTTSASAMENDPRWAMLPEPLALPSESSETPAAPAPLAGTELQTQTANEASNLLEAGEAALQRHDRQLALELFGQAHLLREQLNRTDQQRLQDRLQMLAAEPADTTITAQTTAETQDPSAEALPAPRAATPADVVATPSEPASAGASLIDSAGASEQVLARQLSAEVGKRQSEAQRLRTEDPERALAILREAQTMVHDSTLPESSRRELLSRIDITLNKTEKYIADHRAEIDLDKQNEAVMDEVERSREVKLKVQQKIAESIEEFNRLRDEQRYAEMQIVARRLYELAPQDPVAQQVYEQAKFIRREMMNRDLMDQREESFWAQLNAVEESAVNPVAEDGKELRFDQKLWDQFAKNRKGSKERNERRTERELEIERRLRAPVQLRYQDTPLSKVIDDLSQLTGVNIHLDPRGLSQEGINSDTPVTINIPKEISLKSALNLILEPLHLSYVIKDEVLKITSEQLRDGEIYALTYNVADLVIPIPNFVPSSNIGLQGLINGAQASMGYGQNGFGMPGPSVLVNERGPQKGAAGANDQILAQQLNVAPASGLPSATVPIGGGPGGMGGGANADFDSLIDLIVSTISTETWAENGGGEAEIRPFPTNLTLVISQTQAVHEEIADLLAQLRRLQDLQVTIEVRFIRLNDRFFERIGVDFDMDIQSDVGENIQGGAAFVPPQNSATVGLQFPPTLTAFPNFTADLDIPYHNESFDLTRLTPFGASQQVATFGFAILSDIEAFFLIEAAQGDRRSNVLNAPKVTLFNGQQAFVSDQTQRPFVIGVIPVVGEFASALQPVIVVLSEGTMMTIQAVVSDDRRYVRLTVVPFFTQIGEVDEFTFEGSTSSTSSSSSTDENEGESKSKEESTADVRSGVTVQQPSFSFISVVTTVSVPDGGTVLLGGIKRLSEGRNEFGVPLLSKVPYVNRLFKNVGIGRETDSIMMMVTPRIIIQEEEEERLGIAVP